MYTHLFYHRKTPLLAAVYIDSDVFSDWFTHGGKNWASLVYTPPPLFWWENLRISRLPHTHTFSILTIIYALSGWWERGTHKIVFAVGSVDWKAKCLLQSGRNDGL